MLLILLSLSLGPPKTSQGILSGTVEASFVCTIAAPTTGVVNISMPNAVSKLLNPQTYVYDLEIHTAADAFVQRILYGTVKVVAEVTR